MSMKQVALAALLTAAFSAGAQTTVYDTFNEDDQQNLFDCCNALPFGFPASIAIPFTPTAFAKVVEIDVAMSTAHPKQGRRDIYLMGSYMGLPGKRAKLRFQKVSSPRLGQCCQFEALDKGEVAQVEPGGHYWIVIAAMHKSGGRGGWNLNTLGQSGPYATMGADRMWTMTAGPLPAVRVIAK